MTSFLKSVRTKKFSGVEPNPPGILTASESPSEIPIAAALKYDAKVSAGCL